MFLTAAISCDRRCISQHEHIILSLSGGGSFHCIDILAEIHDICSQLTNPFKNRVVHYRDLFSFSVMNWWEAAGLKHPKTGPRSRIWLGPSHFFLVLMMRMDLLQMTTQRLQRPLSHLLFRATLDHRTMVQWCIMQLKAEMAKVLGERALNHPMMRLKN